MRAIDQYVRTHRLISLSVVSLGVVLPVLMCCLTGYAFSSPVGAVIASMLLPAAIGLALLEPHLTTRLRRELRANRGALCPGCAYSLNDLSAETCPECGEHWNPATAREAWREVMGAAGADMLAESFGDRDAGAR